jgi:hypothetical protein
VYKLTAKFTGTINSEVTAAQLTKLEEAMESEIFVDAKWVKVRKMSSSRRRLASSTTLEFKVYYAFRDEATRDAAVAIITTQVQTSYADMVTKVAAKLEEGAFKEAFKAITINSASLTTEKTKADEYVDCADEEEELNELCKYGCVEECHTAILTFKEDLCPNYVPDESLTVIMENCDEGYLDLASHHGSSVLKCMLSLVMGVLGYLRFM